MVAALLLAVALPAQATTTEVGSHVVQQFRIHRASGSTTTVLGVEDASGDLGMYGYVSGGRFWVTDGEVDGQARAPIEVSGIGHGWHRVDLLLRGATYELHFDQTIVVTGRTFAPMAAGRPLEDPTGLLPLRPERVDFAWQRVDNDDMAHDTSFTRSLVSSG